MSACFFKYQFVVCMISISSLLVACSEDDPVIQSATTSEISSTQLTLSVPRTITNVCAPGVLQLSLQITKNGSTNTIAVPDYSDAWKASTPIQSGTDADIELNWLHNENVPLASLKTKRTFTSGQTVQLDEQGYTSTDTDNDGFSNIAELCASPASDHNNIDSTPAIQSTTDPVLSNITPSQLDLSANVLDATSGTFQFSNISSGESVLDYTITSDQAFPIFSQSSGKLRSGETQTIVADVVCSSEAGLFEATIAVKTNAGEVGVPVSLDCQSSESSSNIAVLSYLTTDKFLLESDVNQSKSGVILFTNTGDIPLEYQVKNNNTFFGVSPSTGSVRPGATEELTIVGRCGENPVILSDSFLLEGNFFEGKQIQVTLDCSGSLPSVFIGNNYEAALIATFGTINNTRLTAAFSAFTILTPAVLEINQNSVQTFLTEISRGVESQDENGNPVYSAKFKCNAGGSVDVERKGMQFDATLFGCKFFAFELSGKLLDTGVNTSPARSFSTFNISATFPNGKLTQSGSYTSSTDSTQSVYEYRDIQQTFETGRSYYAISNGFTSASVINGVYRSEFEFDLVGDLTDNQVFKVKSDDVDKIETVEGAYYRQGSFTVKNVNGDGVMKIEPIENDLQNFQLTLTDNGNPSVPILIPWSDKFYFPCASASPKIDANTYVCREF